jgi:uncharacterized protein YggE
MLKAVLILTLLPCAFLLGQVNGPGSQVPPNSVTVNISRNANLQPDQILLGIVVNTGPAATLDQVLAALQGSGITQANFSSLSSSQQYSPKGGPAQQLAWGFSLPVAFSNLKSTVTMLSALQTAIAKNNPGFTMSFAVQGTQVSPQAQQSVSCAAADLIADARARAQSVAAAASQSLGPLLAMSSASTATGPLSGIFATPTYLPVCSLTATFALGASPAPGAITIAASRTMSVQPDQAVIVVNVSAGLTLTLNDIVAELEGSGITAANFVGAYGQANSTQWNFSLPVSFAQLPAELSTLAQLQQTLGASKGLPYLTYSVQGTQVSPGLQASQTCSLSGLVSDAQSQALKLAQAAGVTLGPVISVTDSTGTRAGDLAAVIYDPTTGNPFGGIQSVLPAPPPCALTVQFQLH